MIFVMLMKACRQEMVCTLQRFRSRCLADGFGIRLRGLNVGGEGDVTFWEAVLSKLGRSQMGGDQGESLRNCSNPTLDFPPQKGLPGSDLCQR